MSDKFVEQLLFKYFSGDAVSEEQSLILEWLKESEEHRELYRECSEKWALQQMPGIAENKTKMHFRILNQLITRQEKHRRRILLNMRRFAAVFVLVTAANRLILNNIRL